MKMGHDIMALTERNEISRHWNLEADRIDGDLEFSHKGLEFQRCIQEVLIIVFLDPQMKR
jgi:hypothetical protein